MRACIFILVKCTDLLLFLNTVAHNFNDEKVRESAKVEMVDLEKVSVQSLDIPRYNANGLEISNYDIETLSANEMMNDNIVTVLLR